MIKKTLKYMALAGVLSIGMASIADAAVVIVRTPGPPPPPAHVAGACVYKNGQVRCYEYGHYVYYRATGVRCNAYNVCSYCYMTPHGKICNNTGRLY
jgi:hypothetical protein